MDLRTKHGMRKTRLYDIWVNMRQRCNNPETREYHRYGGRGIKVCDEWDYSFIPFKDWALANGYSDDLTIDRKNNDGNYCSENCRWVDRKTQMNNYSRNHVIEFNGKSQTLQQWSDELDINSSTIRERLNKWEWTIEEALSSIPTHTKTIETESGIKKICATCQDPYPMTNEFFASKSNTKDGFNSQCKKCVREYNKKYWKEKRK